MKVNMYIIAVLILLSASSCQKEYEAPKSNVVDMSGRWWIQLWYDSDGDGVLNLEEDVLYIDYADSGFDFTTTNTSANDMDSLWLIDNEIWPFQAKVAVANRDVLLGTYKSIVSSQDGSDLTVTTEGRILPKAATSLIGNKLDSIFLKIEFSDDPGEVYFYSGIKYTGQPDEEY